MHFQGLFVEVFARKEMVGYSHGELALFIYKTLFEWALVWGSFDEMEWNVIWCEEL